MRFFYGDWGGSGMSSTPYFERSNISRVYSEILEYLKTTHGYSKFDSVNNFHLSNAIAVIRGYTVVKKWINTFSRLGLIKLASINKRLFESDLYDDTTKLIDELEANSIVRELTRKYLGREPAHKDVEYWKKFFINDGTLRYASYWKMTEIKEEKIEDELLNEIERMKNTGERMSRLSEKHISRGNEVDERIAEEIEGKIGKYPDEEIDEEGIICSCGHKNPNDAKFCIKCGEDILF